MGETDGFEWDDRKDRANADKHGIPLRFAVLLFDGRFIVERAAKTMPGEERFMAIGVVAARVLTCVFPYIAGRRRLISLRPASRAERGLYVAQVDQGKA